MQPFSFRRSIRLTMLLGLFMLSGMILAQDEPELPDPEVPVFEINPDSSQPIIIPAATGTHRVIVGVNVSNYALETRLEGAAAVFDQRQQIDNAQTVLYTDIVNSGARVDNVHFYETVPYLVLEVDDAGLAALQNNPQVTSITPDYLEEAFATPADLTYAVINSDDAVNAGFDGTNQVVAVIDQGLFLPHQGFTNMTIVEEACFSTTSGSLTTTCPGGVFELVGPGASRPTGVTPSNHVHGMHVTGTVAGHDGQAGGFRGVAPGTSIISINGFGSTGSGSSSLVSDSTRALEWIYENREKYNIVAVNMSLGGGQYSSQSACATDDAARGAVIDQLKEAGIQVIAASGNNGFVSAMSRPACHANAVSVGSTTVEGTGTINDLCDAPVGTDTVSTFSNSASFLDLLAPGQCVYSTVLDNAFDSWQGTSMATPHVAGAWSILSQAYPHATPDQLLTAFKDTGVSVVDSGNGFTFPRIDVWAALDMAVTTPTAISPITGGSTALQPIFSWDSVPYANRYRVIVTQEGSEVANEIVTNCTTATCNYTLSTELTVGEYEWTMAAINPRGTESSQTTPRTFTADPNFQQTVDPNAITLDAPAGNVTQSTGNPTYRWVASTGSTNYQFYLAPTSDLFAYRFFGDISATKYCANNICSVDLTTLAATAWLNNDTYSVYIKANNGDWRGPFDFTINTPASIAPTIKGFTETDNDLNRPVVQIELTGTATNIGWFQVYIGPSDDIFNVDRSLFQWFSREEVCGNFTEFNCDWRIPKSLELGVYYDMYIQAWSPEGLVDWTGPFGFNVGGPLPAVPANITRTATGNPPTISWDDDPVAQKYDIWIGDVTKDFSEAFFGQNVTKASLNCTEGRCSFTPPVALDNGSYSVYMRAYGEFGGSRGGPLNIGWAEAKNLFGIP